MVSLRKRDLGHSRQRLPPLVRVSRTYLRHFLDKPDRVSSHTRANPPRLAAVLWWSPVPAWLKVIAYGHITEILRATQACEAADALEPEGTDVTRCALLGTGRSGGYRARHGLPHNRITSASLRHHRQGTTPPPRRQYDSNTTETDQLRMTDTPSRRPAEPSAPESADTPVSHQPSPANDATAGAGVGAAAAAGTGAGAEAVAEASAGVAGAAGAAGAAKPAIPVQTGGTAQPPRRSFARTDAAGQGPGAGSGEAGSANTGPAWSAGPAGPAGPAWGQVPPAPVPGWVWSGSWVPKPGIVPLRPLRVGEIVSGSIGLVTRYWRTVLTVSAAVAALSQLMVALVTASLSATSGKMTLTSSGDPSADLHRALVSLGDIAPLAGATGAISLFAGTLATAGLATVASKAVMGKPASPAEAWRAVSSHLLSLVGLSLITTCATFGTLAASAAPCLIGNAAHSSDAAISASALLLLPGSAIALWLCISMGLAAPALVLERQGIRAALTRSFRLVRGAWWRVFGVTLLVGLLTGLVSGFIALPFTVVDLIVNGSGSDGTSVSSLLLTAIGGFIGAALTLPVTAGSSALLYIDQRIRREALDLDLAAAVGIPNYGH